MNSREGTRTSRRFLRLYIWRNLGRRGGGIVPRARVRGSPMNGGRRPVGTRKVWGSGKVLGGSSDGRELLEWSGKDGAESLRIFILYGRCFA